MLFWYLLYCYFIRAVVKDYQHYRSFWLDLVPEWLSVIRVIWFRCHRAVTMSAVARDSPQMMGEAADTPRCPVLQRDWLGEGQLSLWLGINGKGWSRGPPVALPLHWVAFKHAHTLLDFWSAEKVASTNPAFTTIGHNHWPEDRLC